jgi:hypothetical protein
MQRMIADRSRPGRRAQRPERMPGRLVWPGVGRWSRLWHLTWENLASWSPIALQRLKIAYGRSHRTAAALLVSLLRDRYLISISIEYEYD